MEGGSEVPRSRLGEVVESLPGKWDVLVADTEGAEIGLIECDFAALLACKRLIFELHDASFTGKHFTVDEVAREVLRSGGFRLLGRDGNVFCIERGNGGFREQ